MRRITFSIIIVILISLPVLSKDDPTLYDSYDLAPGAVPGYITGGTDPWELQYAWEDMEEQTGDNGMLGIAFDGNLIWVTGRGVTADNMFYLFDPYSGLMVNSVPTGTTTSWGVRDMCFDGTYMYGGAEGGLYYWDITTYQIAGIIQIQGGLTFPRANAYDPATDHFYCGNFGSTCYEMDRNGNVIRTWAPAPLTSIYGMAWDDDAIDGPWLWIHDQTTPVSGCNLHQFDPVTLTYTGYSVTLDVPPSPSDMAGGLDYAHGLDPLYSSMLVFNQGTPDAGAAFGLYIVSDPQSPGMPEDFSVEHNGPELIATLNWVNPSLQICGNPLTDLDGIRINRNGELVETLTDLIIGAPVSYDDITVPAAGMCNYELVPFNDFGDGFRAYASEWIGPDVPGPPLFFNVEPSPGGFLEATLTWIPPTYGAHGGYFSGTDSYNIYRALQGMPLELVADMVTGTSYVDEVMIQGWYDYAVAGVNESGEGDLSDIETVYLGSPEFEQIPYNWYDISEIGTNAGITGDDQNLGPFDMGFVFPWYSNVYSSVRICSNGFISFTSTSTAYSNAAIPTTNEPNNLIAPYWDDFNPSGDYYGEYYYYHDAANDRFIVQFDSLNFYLTATGDYASFQATTP